ncbi:MAG: ABC transporter ATP-binding protein [Deltaproteobacteria bacterium]|jgi:ABC-type sugar transport system ATPase subunit|nr:ABC transporter ATP-binding protein [Deltaproteobacteria bacterium]
MGLSIELKDLRKNFGKMTALEQINLSIEEGEFIALLGPSGCGKTTLLRCIAGLELPDQGEILIGDQTVYSSENGIAVPSGKRHLGMVFQSYALWPHMTIYDNIGFGLRLQKKSQSETIACVDQVLKDLGMAGLGHRYPSELSGGQQQRVAVARLLATKPPVFLMDEPLSNLDARLRLDMRSELKRLHHETGVTTIYVTHDQTEAMTMASRIVVMNSGKIQQIASPKEIYHKPANLFVADFVGMPRINMFPAEMTQEKDQSYLFIDGLKIKMASSNTYSNLVAAVRPESIQIYNEQEQDSIDYEVYSVLPAGPELFVMAKKGNQNILIRETRQIDLEMGQTIWIKIDPLAVNLYDKDSGLLLNPS